MLTTRAPILVPQRYNAAWDPPPVLWQSAAMTITYANGTKVEGIVLARSEEGMRIALRGCRDSVEFVARPDGTWLSETGEIVRIGSQSADASPGESLEDFLCPQDLVARLVGTLDMAPFYATAAVV